MTVILIVLFFMPTVAAHLRGHPQANAIASLNAALLLPILFGLGMTWVVVGWAIAITWASTRIERKAP